jgi:hypothetical protein
LDSRTPTDPSLDDGGLRFQYELPSIPYGVTSRFSVRYLCYWTPCINIILYLRSISNVVVVGTVVVVVGGGAAVVVVVVVVVGTVVVVKMRVTFDRMSFWPENSSIKISVILLNPSSNPSVI